MEYTEQQKQEIKEKYARRRRNQLLLSGAAIVLAITLGLWGGTRGGAAKVDPAYIGIFFVFLLFLVIFSFRNWRCPARGQMFGRSTWRMNFCPRCGVALR